MAKFKLLIDTNGAYLLSEETLNEQSIRDLLFISPNVESEAIKYIVEKDALVIVPSRIEAGNMFMGGPYRIISYTKEHLIDRLEEETQNDILFICAFRYYHDTGADKFRYVVYYYYASHRVVENFGKSEFRKIELDKILKEL